MGVTSTQVTVSVAMETLLSDACAKMDFRLKMMFVSKVRMHMTMHKYYIKDMYLQGQCLLS